jgi:hypothetical protein
MPCAIVINATIYRVQGQTAKPLALTATPTAGFKARRPPAIALPPPPPVSRSRLVQDHPYLSTIYVL